MKMWQSLADAYSMTKGIELTVTAAKRKDEENKLDGTSDKGIGRDQRSKPSSLLF